MDPALAVQFEVERQPPRGEPISRDHQPASMKFSALFLTEAAARYARSKWFVPPPQNWLATRILEPTGLMQEI